MQWKTHLSESTSKEIFLRGYSLSDLIEKFNFLQSIFLFLKGEFPSIKEEEMLNALFVAALDHGMAPPSTQAARLIASGGSSFNVAVAGGILAFGEYHGGAIEGCAKLLFSGVKENKTAQEIVKHYIADKKNIPGFGHKLYKDEDPRSRALIKKAKKLGFHKTFLPLALEIGDEFLTQKGKVLPINIDGTMAAIILEMGFPWQLAKGFFIIARTVGLVAHVGEEIINEHPFRRLSDEEIEYLGEKGKILKV